MSTDPAVTDGAKDAGFLTVRGLKKYFPIRRGVLWERTVGDVKAVDDVSFEIAEGETLRLVGGTLAGGRRRCSTKGSSTAHCASVSMPAVSPQSGDNGRAADRFRC